MSADAIYTAVLIAAAMVMERDGPCAVLGVLFSMIAIVNVLIMGSVAP